MKTEEIESLEDLVRHAGEGWLIDSYHPPERAADALTERLAKVDQFAASRFSAGTVRITPDRLIANYKRYPHKVRAFIQAIGESDSPAMLTMVWRIIQGMEIASVQMNYVQSSEFRLSVTLVSPYGDPEEHYESDDIDDAALLRHFGIMKVDGKPLFDGFYAANKTGEMKA